MAFNNFLSTENVDFIYVLRCLFRLDLDQLQIQQIQSEPPVETNQEIEERSQKMVTHHDIFQIRLCHAFFQFERLRNRRWSCLPLLHLVLNCFDDCWWIHGSGASRHDRTFLCLSNACPRCTAFFVAAVTLNEYLL